MVLFAVLERLVACGYVPMSKLYVVYNSSVLRNVSE